MTWKILNDDRQVFFKERTWSSAGSRNSLTLPDFPIPFSVCTHRLIK